MKRGIILACIGIVLLSSQAIIGAAGKTTIVSGKESGKFKITAVAENSIQIRLQLKVLAVNIPGISLTFKTEVPKDWRYCLVTQGKTARIYPVTAKVIQYEVVPENGTISLEKSPGPVISRNAPVFDSTQSGSAYLANDNNYFSSWAGSVPGWIAYDLSGVPAVQRGRIIVVWYAEGARDYDHSLVGSEVYQNVLEPLPR